MDDKRASSLSTWSCQPTIPGPGGRDALRCAICGSPPRQYGPGACLGPPSTARGRGTATPGPARVPEELGTSSTGSDCQWASGARENMRAGPMPSRTGLSSMAATAAPLRAGAGALARQFCRRFATGNAGAEMAVARTAADGRTWASARGPRWVSLSGCPGEIRVRPRVHAPHPRKAPSETAIPGWLLISGPGKL